MPLPAQSTLHVNRPLTNVSVAYMQHRMATFVAPTAFPVVPVSNSSDIYYKFDKGDWLRGGAKKRAPGTESAGGGFRLSTDTYTAEVWALHMDVNDPDRARADEQVGSLDVHAAEWVASQHVNTLEASWAAAHMTTGVWSTDLAGTTDFVKWSNYTTGDPALVISDRKRIMKAATGYTPNKLIVGQIVHDRLKLHPLIRDQYKYTSSESITAEMIARALEVDQYIVADSIINNGVEGGADSIAFNIDDDALLLYAAPSPSLMVPTAGYTFVWSGYLGSAALAPQISTFRMDPIKSDRVEGEVAYVFKVVATDLGVFMADVVD